MNRLLWSAVSISSPILIAALVVGLAVSVLQVATQLQEATLSYVPKMVAAAIMLLALGPWMIHQITAFALYAFKLIPSLAAS